MVWLFWFLIRSVLGGTAARCARRGRGFRIGHFISCWFTSALASRRVRRVGAACASASWTVRSSTLDNYPALVRVFGRSRNQHGTSRQPLMRWAGLFCAASGAVLDVAFGPYTCSEARLFLVLLLRQGPGRLWIGDAAYCSYVHLALLGKAGSHFLGVRPASRNENRLRKLGKGDELHVWTRPRPEHSAFARFLSDVPETLTVRVLRASLRRKGYRTRSIVLCTTLLDPAAYPAAELVHCYAQRWDVELDLRAIKVDHGAGHLNARKPRTAVHEFYACLLAYNLVRALAQQTGVPVQSSVTRACRRCSRKPRTK
ncbi:MAG: transposase [Planctomycetota bacterium]|nr:transposase [Planctomycetota bacterium]